MNHNDFLIWELLAVVVVLLVLVMWLWRRLALCQERLIQARYFQPPRILTETQQKRHDLERLLALAGMGENNQVWKTVLSYADEHQRNEQEAALRPDLADSVRHYTAGRAAGALDFAQALRDLRLKAEAEAKRMEKQG